MNIQSQRSRATLDLTALFSDQVCPEGSARHGPGELVGLTLLVGCVSFWSVNPVSAQSGFGGEQRLSPLTRNIMLADLRQGGKASALYGTSTSDGRYHHI